MLVGKVQVKGVSCQRDFLQLHFYTDVLFLLGTLIEDRQSFAEDFVSVSPTFEGLPTANPGVGVFETQWQIWLTLTRFAKTVFPCLATMTTSHV